MPDLTRRIGGKIYKGHGPLYCPGGCSWKELEKHVKKLRETHSVRVEKIKMTDKHPIHKHNTHTVWLWVR